MATVAVMMPSATIMLMLMVMMPVFMPTATTTIVTTTITIASAAASSFSAHTVHHPFNFFIGGFACFHDRTFEMQCFAG